VADGGWVPLVAAAAVFLLMEAWRSGRAAMLRQLERETMPLDLFIGSTANEIKVPGTAVYLSRRSDVVPVAMLHSMKHYHVLHQRNVILHVETEKVPRVPDRERISLNDLGNDFYRIELQYGFMQQPDIPAALAHCPCGGQAFDMMQTSFFLSRVSISTSGTVKGRMNPLLRSLFAWLHRNATDSTEFFRIPRNRIVELGTRIEL
jgi:KUP system potassium uptake protein